MKKLFIATAVVIGILLAIQIRSFKKVDFLLQRSGQGNLMHELKVFQVANQNLRDHLAETKISLIDMQSRITAQTIDEEIKRLRLLAGEDAVSGEGIEITIPISIDAFWIIDLVAQLRAVGAEAVALNDIRYVSKTAGMRQIKPSGLLMRRTFLRPPFRISAIGPSRELKNTLTQSGSILNRIEQNHPGLKITVAQREKIEIPGLGSLTN